MELLEIDFNTISDFFSLSKLYVKLACLVLLIILSFVLFQALFNGLKMLIVKRSTASVHLIDLKLRIASSALFCAIILNLALPLIQFDNPLNYYLKKFLFIGFVFSLAYLAKKFTEYFKDYVYFNSSLYKKDNLSNRKIRTQIDFLQKVLSVFIFIIAISIVLMSFSRVREVGTSIIASAGIAGIIIGFAAQKSLSNLLAGLQIAVTQPLRIDDVVVVENEWGRIEEITLTYVVVKIWDQRRLILPISYFIEKPFQNWTRNSSEIIGTIFLYVDYSVSIDILRDKMMEILKSTDLWDGKSAALQVVELTEKSIQLRGVMSSVNAADSWDLKCLVREKLIEFINENFPHALPHLRSKSVNIEVEKNNKN